MRKKVRYLIALTLWIGGWTLYAYSADERIPVRTQTHLKVGDPAPDFTLPANIPVDGKGKVTLSQFKGKKNVVLSFHVLDWTPV
jgi:peroxiredoxin (alkyl hydroperoxide reductase subunit C)